MDVFQLWDYYVLQNISKVVNSPELQVKVMVVFALFVMLIAFWIIKQKSSSANCNSM